MAKGDTPQVNVPSIYNPSPAPSVAQGDPYQAYNPLLNLLMKTKYPDQQSLNEAQNLESQMFPTMAGMAAYGKQNQELGPVPAPLGLLSNHLTTILLKTKKDQDRKNGQ